LPSLGQILRVGGAYGSEVGSMQQSRSGQMHILRLDDGEDILESILKSVKDSRSTMLICTGLGMITDFELGFFERGEYIRKSYTEPHELLSVQGAISGYGEHRVHVHVSVADKEHRMFGGHLLGGKVWMSNEIGILRLDGVRSSRGIDPEKNVTTLSLQ
jgi:predicted DNA-binding protein with PD1-like motif